MLMVVNQNSKIFEVDNDIFEDVKKFLKNLAKNKQKSFSYIDELGDVVVVNGDKEMVMPTKDDVLAISDKKNDEFIDEEEVKKLLCI